MQSDPLFLVFLNKRWKFLRCTLSKDLCGQCDDPTVTDKAIKVSKKLVGRDELDTILHECLHACFWHLDEGIVEQASTDLARALWRLGYRKVNE
jgi:hypothetical protein